MGIFLPMPITQKQFYSGKHDKMKFSLCQMQGWRRQMEDAAICQPNLGDGNSLFAVFDGHGGSQVSQFVKTIFKSVLLNNQFYHLGKYETAMVEVFKQIDLKLRSEQGQMQLLKLRRQKNSKTDRRCMKDGRIGNQVGCTANVVLITPLVYVVANCGDSRSILNRKKKFTRLSFDHKPENPSQTQRIQKAGGEVISGRINGNLNLSRGFGDFRYKNSALNYEQTIVTCLPDVRIFPRSLEDQFIVVGCDGIFQKYVYEQQPLINFIKRERKWKKNGERILTKLFDSLLAKDVTEITGCDNMTCILIELS